MSSYRVKISWRDAEIEDWVWLEDSNEEHLKKAARRVARELWMLNSHIGRLQKRNQKGEWIPA